MLKAKITWVGNYFGNIRITPEYPTHPKVLGLGLGLGLGSQEELGLGLGSGLGLGLGIRVRVRYVCRCL